MRKVLALGAMAFASLGIASPAMAQCAANGWCSVRDYSDMSVYQKRVSRDARYAVVYVKKVPSDTRRETSTFKIVYDCQADRYRFADSQKWSDILPDSRGMTNLRFACR
jgi:hypothetical protein